MQTRANKSVFVGHFARCILNLMQRYEENLKLSAKQENIMVN